LVGRHSLLIAHPSQLAEAFRCREIILEVGFGHARPADEGQEAEAGIPPQHGLHAQLEVGLRQPGAADADGFPHLHRRLNQQRLEHAPDGGRNAPRGGRIESLSHQVVGQRLDQSAFLLDARPLCRRPAFHALDELADAQQVVGGLADRGDEVSLGFG